MAVKRKSPYIWVTWLTRLLVGEHNCEWGAWFKTQHESNSWQKAPRAYDLTLWQIDHTVLLKETKARLESQGKVVFIEGQNSFVLRGNSAAIGGKPDIIAIAGDKGLIIDVKTGKHSPAHHIQVMVYMYAVPRVLQQFKGVQFDGRVVYKDKQVEIPMASIDEKFIENLSGLIKRLGSPTPAVKVPNFVECSYCDITRADCPERLTDEFVCSGETHDF